VLSQFRTPYCRNLWQYSKKPKRCAWQCTDPKLTIFASNFCARKLCRPIALQPSVAIATCRKTCSCQIVLLQMQGFQNVGCQCHFDTQNRLKKTGSRYPGLCKHYTTTASKRFARKFTLVVYLTELPHSFCRIKFVFLWGFFLTILFLFSCSLNWFGRLACLWFRMPFRGEAFLLYWLITACLDRSVAIAAFVGKARCRRAWS